MVFITQGQAIVWQSRLVKMKQFCAAFKAAHEFTITDSRTAILILLSDFIGRSKGKCFTMLNFIRAKISCNIAADCFSPK